MKYLIGPELFWLLLYICANLAAKINASPDKPLDSFIDQCWFWIPALSTLVFALWWMPSVDQNWLLLRVWIAGIIGGHFVVERVIRAYSEQGPGSGMGYLAAMMLEFVVLAGGSIVVLIKSKWF